MFTNPAKLVISTLMCSIVLASISQSLAQELKPVPKPPKFGTFWLLSSELDGRKSPPLPLDPYGGVLPVYEMEGFPGRYLVGDSPEDYQQLKSEKSRASSQTVSLGVPNCQLNYPFYLANDFYK